MAARGIDQEQVGGRKWQLQKSRVKRCILRLDTIDQETASRTQRRSHDFPQCVEEASLDATARVGTAVMI
jgi:hypothetical protein